MQASRIKIGGDYAVLRDNKLRALRVMSIKTTRTLGDVYNYATGYLTDETGATIRGEDELVYKVEDVIGPFEEQIEAFAARERARAAKDAAEQADKDAADELVRVLFNAAGLAIPNEPTKWKDPFVNDYGGQVRIDPAGVKMLLEALRRKAA